MLVERPRRRSGRTLPLPRRGALAAVAPVVVACAPLAVLAAIDVAAGSSPRPISGDFAVMEIATREALGGEQILGPYSRFGWYHPGPALFYWLAPFYAVADQQAGGLASGAAVLNLISAGVIVGLVAKVRGQIAAWAAAAVVLVASVGIGLSVLHSPWNPYVGILPLSAFGVLAAGVGGGRRWALPAAVALGSLVVQSHVGAALPALAMAVPATVVTLVFHRRPARRWARPAAATALVVAALWGPVVWQQATGEPGNLSQLADFFVAGNTDTGTGPAPHLDPPSWNEIRAPLWVSLAPVRWDDPVVRDPISGQPVLAAIGVVAVAAAAVVAGRRRWPFELALAGVGLAGIAGSLVAVGSIEGPPALYLFSSVAGVAVVVWTAVVITLARVVGPLVARAGAQSGPRGRALLRGGRAVVPTVVVVGAVLFVGVAARTPAWNLSGDDDPVLSHPPLAALDDQVAAGVAAAGCGQPRELSPAPDLQGCTVRVVYHSAWATSAGLVNDLDRHGATVTVDAPNRHIYGTGLRPTGIEDLSLFVLPPGAPPQRGVGELVTDHGSADVYLTEGPSRLRIDH